jgi:hypothetical protein
MIDALKRFMKLLNAVAKLVPVIIEVLSDLADDGEINHSTARSTSKTAKRAAAASK